MPEFNKAEYWKNRRDGRRGQGETVRPHHETAGGLLGQMTNREIDRRESRQKPARRVTNRQAPDPMTINRAVLRREAGEQQRIAKKKKVQLESANR